MCWSSVRTRRLGVIWIVYRALCPFYVSLGSLEECQAWARSVAAGPLRQDPEASGALKAAVRAVVDRGQAYEGPVGLIGKTPFQCAVLAATRAIGRGQTRTYGEIAAAIGRPRSARAVGSALAANPLPLLIPCHRVVGAGRRLGQYSDGGPAMKRRLLAAEGVDVAVLR